MVKFWRAEGTPTVTKIYDDVIDDVTKVNPNFTFFVNANFSKNVQTPQK